MRKPPTLFHALPLCFAVSVALASALSCVAPAGAAPPAAPTLADAIHHTAYVTGREFGVNPDFLVCVAWQESTFRPGVVDPSGSYRGLYQFSRGTWPLAARLAGYGPTVAGNWHVYAHDVTASTRAAAALMARPDLGGTSHWPVTARRCRSLWRWL